MKNFGGRYLHLKTYLFVLVSLGLFVSCLGRESKINSATSSSLSSGNNPGGGNPAAPGTVLISSTAPKQIMNLGTAVSFPISLQSQGYTGIVSLKSDLAAIKALDAALNQFMRSVVVRFKIDNDVRLVEQLDVALTAGQSLPVTVIIETDSRAPDFNNMFKLQAVKADGSMLDSEDILLEIKNTYEMRIFAGPVNVIDTPSLWSNTKDAYLRPHAGGINLMFVNYDPTERHIVHSNNTQLFPHEPDPGMAPALNATTPNPNGGTYNTLNTRVQATTGTYYLHDEENGNIVTSRSIAINSTIMIPTFTRIKSEIIDRKCIACHGAGSANPLVTAADFRNMIANKFGGNGQLFIDQFTGATGYRMPQGRPALSIDEQHYLADYIRSGAPN
jgi:hypothetical protein